MARDPKEQRLKNIQRRFRRVRARQDFRDEYRRTVRKPSTWLMAFLVFAATLALLLALLGF